MYKIYTVNKENKTVPQLAPYATDVTALTPQENQRTHALTDTRTPFQHDHDRIIHSSAFRRLQHKTQVMHNSEEGDFRTRLTHTLEVAQLSRSLARMMNVDSDLAEICALAHDLGHPPFGHAGEDALDAKMKAFGGFEHNLQTMSILRQLECTYAAYDGLNLTWESLEGIAKHNGPLPENQHNNALVSDLKPASYASLEAQIAAICDDIAYNHHDMEDGFATGKLHFEEIVALPSIAPIWQEIKSTYPHADTFRYVKELARHLIHRAMQDVLSQTRKNLDALQPTSVEDIRNAPVQLVMFSPSGADAIKELKTFLFENMYRHHEINRQAFKGHKMINELFDAFMNHKKLLPPYTLSRLDTLDMQDDTHKARVVCDYIASLTDRSVAREYTRIFGDIEWR